MDKRTLKREYKEAEIPMGVYRIWNKRSDRSLVGSSLNLPAILNRSRSELRLGGHRNRELQSDWNALGEEAFELEILDTLPPRDEPGYDARRELKVLEDLWLERLQPYGERGYNPLPRK
jgi:hypothetical protein